MASFHVDGAAKGNLPRPGLQWRDRTPGAAEGRAAYLKESSMIGFVAGAAVGYVLGTRAGRQRYEQIKRGSKRLWQSEPVQGRLEAGKQAVKTQAVPFVADKVGDAVKAAGRQVKAKAGRETLPATLERGPDGELYADATPGRHRSTP